MGSAVPPDSSQSCQGNTPPRPGLAGAFPAVLQPWKQDPPCAKQRDSTPEHPNGCVEGNRLCCEDGNVEEPLCAQDRGVSRSSGEPQDGAKRPLRRCQALWDLPRHTRALLLALLLALVVIVTLALKVDCSAQPAGRQGAGPAVTLGCPDGWVGYRKLCYYLSKLEEEEGSWGRSRERCSALGASLAVLRREWEVEFLSRLKGRVDYWIGLRDQGGSLEWVDGSSFNLTVETRGRGPCLYLNNLDLVRSSCSLARPYLCSQPQAGVLQE